jgi:hypothetical protein
MRKSRAAPIRGLAGVLLLSAAACSRHFDVPVPIPEGVVQDIPPVEAATIAIPVTIAMSGIKARIDSVFPASDSLDRAKCSVAAGLVCHQYVYRRDTLDLKMINDRITLFTRVRFRARVALPGGIGVASCGYAHEAMKRAEMRLATNLYWRTDWRLGSRATVLAPNILDPCEVTMLRVDATPTIKRMIDGQLSHLRQQFDSIVPAVANLKPVADSMWRMLQRPLPLDSASTIWLAMTPDSARLGAPVGTGAAVNSSLVLTARPRVVIGAAPPVEVAPLPMLTLAGPSSGIHMPLEIQVPFDELSRRATALLSGEVAGKGITVGEIKVWGIGDTAVVRVDVTGRMTGALYLLGRVGYDSGARTVLITDLRYTLASADKMTSIKATLGAIRIRHALDQATGHGRLMIGDQLDSVKTQLAAQLNRELAPGVQMTGTIRDVSIERLYSTSSAFVLRVVFDGEARVEVH